MSGFFSGIKFDLRLGKDELSLFESVDKKLMHYGDFTSRVFNHRSALSSAKEATEWVKLVTIGIKNSEF